MTKSHQDIAREAAMDIHRAEHRGQESLTSKVKIILAAIEKAYAEGVNHGLVQPSAAQPQICDVESVMDECNRLRQQLDIERETLRAIRQAGWDRVAKLEQQLAAERETKDNYKRETMELARLLDETRGKLLQAQAAIVKVKAAGYSLFLEDGTSVLDSIDQSLLDAHDAEVREQYIEKLTAILTDRSKGEYDTWGFVAMFLDMMKEANQ